MNSYHAEYAWLEDRAQAAVRISTGAGRITDLQVGVAPLAGDRRLPGLTLPGFANVHSHAFHRALRGRTHQPGGSFWSWRDAMYALAQRLDPDSYLALARAVFAEMALAGISSVGEFHYLHHGPGGRRYADPNAMGIALTHAAAQAGVRITLLDTCYLAGGLGAGGSTPLADAQLRFADRDADEWARRVKAVPAAEHLRVGAALHSVRAVPREQMPAVVEAAAGGPLHVHVSEVAEENEQCLRAYGARPTAVLALAGALGPDTTAVHATHTDAADIAELGRTGTTVALCPSTERDLGDGIGPAAALRDAGCPITLGTDQHGGIDMFLEASAVEMDERLARHDRGAFGAAELIAALTRDGQRSIGWPDAGELRVGARADLVTIRLDTARTAGCDVGQVVFAATTADIVNVVVDGCTVVEDGRHVLGDVGPMLAGAIDPLWL